MATLQKIIGSLAARVDKPFDIPLQEELKHIIDYKRANYTQQFLEKHTDQRQFFLQKVTLELEKAPTDDCQPIKGCVIMRTKCEVPTPIRNSHTLFDFVGETNFMTGYARQEPGFIQDLKYNRFTKVKPRWYYMNNRIYVYNTTTIHRIGLIGIFENPFTVNSCTCDDSQCLTDTDEYPIALDLLNSIVRDTLNVELRQFLLPPNEVEVDMVSELKNSGMKPA